MKKSRIIRNVIIFHLLVVTLLRALSEQAAYGQENQTPSTVQPAAQVFTYQVVAGDTLYILSQRFGTSIDALVAANQLQDPTQLEIGQLLVIPSSIDAALGSPALSTHNVYARPGDTLQTLALRYAQPASLLEILNQVEAGNRLFPGQPILIPQSEGGSLPVLDEPLRFGAVKAIRLTHRILQGRTGRLVVETTRPISLTATFADRVYPLQTLQDQPLRQYLLLPIYALLTPGIYDLTLAYQTASGTTLSHTWPLEIVEGGYLSQTIEVPPEKSDLLASAVIEGELAQLSEVWTAVHNSLQSSGTLSSTFSRPIDLQYLTTSPFGTRREYNSGLYATFHAGQDFGAPEGTPVLAPRAGTVVVADPLRVRGNAVILDHGGGVYTGYWHLSEIRVTPGQIVAPGDLIGIVGNTGLSTGAHLHWELRIGGVAVDPMQFVEEGFLSDE